jgi:DNA polymerase-3 subunit chi
MRTCLLFDGGDERALATARDDWRAVRAAGLPAAYWAQERGRWVEKAAAGA